MRCAAIARSTGRQCGHSALPGGRYCRHHGKGRGEPGGAALFGAVPVGAVPERDSFYAGVLGEEAPELETAAELHGLDGEIALLRVQIRQAAQEGNPEAVRRRIETLLKALKVQYALEGRSSEGLASSIARVLDEVGNELGMAL